MPLLDIHQMTEEDVKTHFITPAIQRKGWMDYMSMETQITDGKVNLRGNLVVREKPKRVDYLLYIDANHPIAVLEAKDNHHTVSFGLQQAKEYTEKLDLPFAYSSNGDGFEDFLRAVRESRETTKWIGVARAMTEKEFWMKLDQVAESKKYTDPVERVKDMAVLLVEGYFVDFLFHLGYLKDAGGELKPAGVLYRFGEAEQGQVSVVACFSSPRSAKTAPEKMIVRKTRVREVINEILKKEHIPGIVVNPYTDRVVIPRVIFEKIILESERIDD